MIAESKQAQTIVNLLHDRVTVPLLAANAVAEKIRAAIVANGLQAHFTAGELSAMQTFVTDLAAVAASPVVAAIENRYVPTHRAQSLIVEDVNDGS